MTSRYPAGGPPWAPQLLPTLLLLLASTCLAALAMVPTAHAGLALNEFIQHFEPLYYDRAALRREHHRVKRDSAPFLRLQLTAHSRLFKMRLQSDSLVFSDDVILESSRGPIAFDTSKVYVGSLEDDDQSSISGIVTSAGYFDGTVSTVSEQYFIEPAQYYFETPQDFHSLIYKASDIIHPNCDQPCSSHELHLRRLEEKKQWTSRSRNRTGETPDAHTIPNLKHSSRLKGSSWKSGTLEEDSRGNARPSQDANSSLCRNLSCSDSYSAHKRRWTANWDAAGSTLPRRRRAAVDPRKTTCMLYLQADHLFYEKFGSEEACIEVITRHVQRVNSIYKVTDFDQDSKADNISFMIKRIKVHTTEAVNDHNYRFPGNYGVEKFLELFSEEDYDAFCLAYMFTYRDFEGGTLGLAWTGDLKNAGGVCEKNGHYRGSLKSLNTGIVTLLNYGKHVPPAVSHVTLAHEIGHNFGSPHDPEHNKICTPGGDDGNYIMFARATSGDKRNNNKFSPCSLNSINPVLNAKARDSKGCFTEPKAAICGNGVVEVGEECDCGWEEDCKEECCFPMRTHLPSNEQPCRLRPGKTCSPSQGPCCTHDCDLKFGDKCRDDNGCRDASYCNGRGPQCPPSTNKPNKTICNEEFVCFMGECTGSICLAYGLESCQCIPGPGDPLTKACELCCQLPGDDQPCLSSFDWNIPPYDIPDMYAKPGTPCNNYNGYCDVFQKCREVDPSGPLSTLRKLLLSDESIASVKKWIADHWYAVLFITAGILIILTVIVKLFGRAPNLKLKTMTILHSTSSEPVRLPHDNSNMTVHPTTVCKKLPLKKKVRDHHSKHHGQRANGKKKAGKLPAKKDKSKESPKKEAAKKSGPSVVMPTVPATGKEPASSSPTVEAGCSIPKPSSSQSPEEPAGSSSHLKPVTTHKPVTAKLLLVKGKKKQHWSGHGKIRSKSPQKVGNRSPTKKPKGFLHIPKSASSSAGEVRVQMVYKPPFKFSFQITTEKKKTVGDKEEKRGRPKGESKRNSYSVVKAPLLRSGKPKSSSDNLQQVAKELLPAALSARPSGSGSLEPERLQRDRSSLAKVYPGCKADPPPLLPSDDVVLAIPSDLEVLFSENETLLSEEEDDGSAKACYAAPESTFDDSCV